TRVAAALCSISCHTISPSGTLCNHVSEALGTSHSLSNLQYYVPHPDQHSFPTRRSSDLPPARRSHTDSRGSAGTDLGETSHGPRDRKSTRLNSSHLVISYAVFCLKKKNS